VIWTLRGLTNLGSVVCGTKNQLWCSVVPRANVGHIWLVLYQNFGTPEITEFQDAGGGIQQQILGLDIAMADALRVNVGQRSEQLINVEFDFEYGHGLLQLAKVSRGAVDCLWDIFKNEVEVDFISLLRVSLACEWPETTKHLPVRHCCSKRP
jgi:hypothetical protein